MRLAKYRIPSGEEAVGQLDEDRLFPLNLSAGHFKSLSDIMEAENPLEAADFLVNRRKAIDAGSVTIVANRPAGSVGRRRDLPAQPVRPNGRVEIGRVVLRPRLFLASPRAVLQGHAPPRFGP